MSTENLGKILYKYTPSFDIAKQNIEKFITEVYNKKRLHSALGYVSPEEFEENLTRQQVHQRQLSTYPQN